MAQYLLKSGANSLRYALFYHIFALFQREEKIPLAGEGLPFPKGGEILPEGKRFFMEGPGGIFESLLQRETKFPPGGEALYLEGPGGIPNLPP